MILEFVEATTYRALLHELGNLRSPQKGTPVDTDHPEKYVLRADIERIITRSYTVTTALASSGSMHERSETVGASSTQQNLNHQPQKPIVKEV